MIEIAPDAEPPRLRLYDAIIDVRSPSEFAEDHVPGAINLPVLSDAERAEVGTIYVQEDRFRARRLGAAYVSRNIARHLESALAGAPRSYRPLLYCWRGGMRSNAMATVLSQIGWRVGVLKGGYKTWRRAVVEALRRSEAPLNLILLDGQTGAAKSEILARAARLGAQTLDLEALARHRGSVFGAIPGAPQPGQKLFESGIYMTLATADPARAIVVEAESAKIGALTIPRRVWSAMRAAPRVEATAPLAARARFLVGTYAATVAAPRLLEAAIERLRPLHTKTEIEEWLALAARSELVPLAERLVAAHYDPAYDRARQRREDVPHAAIALAALEEEDLATAARKLAALAG